MKLKEGWLEPILFLEKEIEKINQAYDMINAHGKTETELGRIKSDRETATYPYRKLLLHAKYLGYELTEEDEMRNTISPLFKL